MKFIISKLNFLIALAFALLVFSGAIQSVQAGTLTSGPGFLQGNVLGDMDNNTRALGATAGYEEGITVGMVVANVIKGFLALLGIIFVILMLVAGFNWMTAAGDEDKITKAKDTIRSAVIGLIIIVAAYSITYFVFENLPDGA